MKTNRRKGKLTDEEIDEIVIAQVDDEMAWEEAVQVKKTKFTEDAAFAGLRRDLAAKFFQ